MRFEIQVTNKFTGKMAQGCAFRTDWASAELEARRLRIIFEQNDVDWEVSILVTFA